MSNLTLYTTQGIPGFTNGSVCCIDEKGVLQWELSAEQVATLRTDLAEAMELLRDVEWPYQQNLDLGGAVRLCHFCGMDEKHGHAPDCKLNTLILRLSSIHPVKRAALTGEEVFSDPTNVDGEAHFNSERNGGRGIR